MFLTSPPCGEQTFLYLCWYLIMSLLGHYNNFFFACHLLDIAMGVKTLRTILSSVTHNGKQVGGGARTRRCSQSSSTDTLVFIHSHPRNIPAYFSLSIRCVEGQKAIGITAQA